MFYVTVRQCDMKGSAEPVVSEVMLTDTSNLTSNNGHSVAPIAHKRRYSSCTILDKLEVLQRIDNGESATKLAQEFRVGYSTISHWKKERPRLELFCNKAISTDAVRKRSKASPFDQLNEALYTWFRDQRERGVFITGPLIQKKALQLNKLLLGENKFAASNGWLHRWKKRHGIRLVPVTADRELATADSTNDTWAEDSGLFTSQSVDSADNTLLFGEFSSRKMCTPDFMLSQDYFEMSDGAPNLTFPTRPRLPVDTDDEARETDVLRERLKKRLAEAVKRYCVPVSKRLESNDKFAEEDLPDEILHLVKVIPPDRDEAGDGSEWVTANISEDFESGDEADEVENNAAKEAEEPVSDIEAARALEVALRYVKRHSEATPSDVMFMERWRNIAKSTLSTDLRQRRND